MRVALVGAGTKAEMTARILVEHGHDVVIIDTDKERIDALRDDLDCSFLHGDGSRPEVLREVDPKSTDVLYCLTGSDQTNLIAGLVGRTLGFRRVVTSIQTPEFEPICAKLGLEDTIVPARTISRYLADMLMGIDVLELRTAIKGEARLFSFIAGEGDAGPIDGLDLPAEARVVWYYRGGEFHLADGATELKAEDEVVIATHSRNLEALTERWKPNES